MKVQWQVSASPKGEGIPIRRAESVALRRNTVEARFKTGSSCDRVFRRPLLELENPRDKSDRVRLLGTGFCQYGSCFVVRRRWGSHCLSEKIEVGAKNF
jgi:hypothetical protein